MKHRLSLPLTALGTAAVLALASCSGATATDSATAPAASSTATPAGDSASSDPRAADALELTGPAEAATVPDVSAAVTDPEPRLPATVKDFTGKTITVEDTDRILALDLYGTLTDTVIGLGLEKNLVGRSNSDTQKALKDLPVVTQDGHDLNTEAVLDLKPTLILTNTTIGSQDKYDQLAAAGITVVTFDETPNLDGIDDAIEEVGDAVGLPEAAQKLAARTEDQLEEAEQSIAALKAATPTPPRGMVLYVRGTAGVFFILGKDYGASDIIDALGLEDVAAENDITQLKPANAESLVKLDPQVILAMTDGVKSTGGIDGLLKRPGMAATTAGENKRVITAADGQLLSYGPRTPANLVALATAIYTEGESK